MTDQNNDMSNANNAAHDIDYNSPEFMAQAAAWAADYYAAEAEADELSDYVTEEQYGCYCIWEGEGYLPCCQVDTPCPIHYKIASYEANWDANANDSKQPPES